MEDSWWVRGMEVRKEVSYPIVEQEQTGESGVIEARHKGEYDEKI